MPFIGLNIPFVGRLRPRIRPFIRINRPSVKSYGFSSFILVESITPVAIADILMARATASVTSKCSKCRAAPVRREP